MHHEDIHSFDNGEIISPIRDQFLFIHFSWTNYFSTQQDLTLSNFHFKILSQQYYTKKTIVYILHLFDYLPSISKQSLTLNSFLTVGLFNYLHCVILSPLVSIVTAGMIILLNSFNYKDYTNSCFRVFCHQRGMKDSQHTTIIHKVLVTLSISFLSQIYIYIYRYPNPIEQVEALFIALK